MNKTLSKIWVGRGIALLALSVMVFLQPVAAEAGDCNVDYHEDPVPVREGAPGMFRFKVQCDTSDWSFKTFRYKYTTQQDSAKGGTDYKGKAGVHVFHPAGAPNYTRITRVTILADNECGEGDEKFKIRYKLQGKTNAGWTDWSEGHGGLPGNFVVEVVIRDSC